MFFNTAAELRDFTTELLDMLQHRLGALVGVIEQQKPQTTK